MSLITRCPVCATTFKVVPDQLRISDGWVRCGRCGEVFDAPVNMCEASDTDTAAELPSLSPAESVEPTAEIDEPPRVPGGTVIDAQWWQNQPSLDMPEPEPEPEPLLAATNATPHDELDDPTVSNIEAATGALEPPVMTSMTFRATADEGVPEASATPNPAFMPGFLKTKTPSVLVQPKARVWWVVLAVVALAALVLQIVFHERDVIAARQPKLKSSLTSLCRLVGCEVSELRQIASIDVGGASFSRDPNSDGYRLYFSLRNRAAMALQMPAIELTLLDSQERPILRRVLLPGEFGAPAVLLPQTERSTSLLMLLSGTEATALPLIAGYHVDPFYP